MVVIPIDFPNPAIPARSVEFLTWLQSTPLNLLGKDRVFGGPGQPAPAYDWPNPRGYVPASDLKTFLKTPPPLFFPLVVPLAGLAYASERAPCLVGAYDSPSGQNWRGPGYMAKYEIDTQIQINGVFTNTLNGVYVDPTSITVFVLDPSGITTSASYTGTPGSPVVKDSQGHYHYNLTPAKSGTWTYKWQASGSATATSPDVTFVINSSALIAG